MAISDDDDDDWFLCLDFDQRGVSVSVFVSLSVVVYIVSGERSSRGIANNF
jgi:hypothetical protein